MIRLREQAGAWLDGQPQSGLFIGGQKVWAVAEGDDSPLAPFYSADIPLHLDPLKAVMSDGMVASVPNGGGAGEAMSATTINAVQQIDGSFVFHGSALATPTPVDLATHRLFMVIKPLHTFGNRQYLGRNAGSADGDQVGFLWQPSNLRTLVQRWNGAISQQIVASGLTFGTDHTAIEVEMSGGRLRSWVNGAENPTANTEWPDLLVNNFFGTANPTPRFPCAGGDVIAVRQGATDAIAAVRSQLAGKHGIAIE